ncbi:MAG: hypothetical protein IJQ39_02400 [Thermoguttaceae bacterium]|nr:hypothetical protein [Thermoguttaceae bacterium]
MRRKLPEIFRTWKGSLCNQPGMSSACGGSFQKSSEREKAARATGSRASSPAKAKLTCNPSSSSAMRRKLPKIFRTWKGSSCNWFAGVFARQSHQKLYDLMQTSTQKMTF